MCSNNPNAGIHRVTQSQKSSRKQWERVVQSTSKRCTRACFYRLSVVVRRPHRQQRRRAAPQFSSFCSNELGNRRHKFHRKPTKVLQLHALFVGCVGCVCACNLCMHLYNSLVPAFLDTTRLKRVCLVVLCCRPCLQSFRWKVNCCIRTLKLLSKFNIIVHFRGQELVSRKVSW